MTAGARELELERELERDEPVREAKPENNGQVQIAAANADRRSSPPTP